MDGAVSGVVAGHDKQGHFTPGHSEYAARQRRIAEKLRQLTADYDCQTPVQRMLLRLAATHLDTAATTRKSLTRERSTNVALRLLSEIPKRKRQRRDQTLTLQEIEDIGRSVK
jgi:hypothetical protein